MAFDFDSDLDACLSTDDFGTAAVFTLNSGADLTVNGLFSDTAEVVDMNDGKVVASAPTLTCKTSETVDVRTGDTVDIEVENETQTFTVEQRLRTGVGFTDFYLKT